MHKRLPSIILSLNSAIFLGIGIVFLIIPAIPLAKLGLKNIPDVALTDIRAVYGGVQIAVGLFLLRAIRAKKDPADGLLLCATLFLGLFLARTYGFFVEDSFGLVDSILVSMEIAGFAASYYGLRLVRANQ